MQKVQTCVACFVTLSMALEGSAGLVSAGPASAFCIVANHLTGPARMISCKSCEVAAIALCARVGCLHTTVTMMLEALRHSLLSKYKDWLDSG
jgi:hypothetical protein